MKKVPEYLDICKAVVYKMGDSCLKEKMRLSAKILLRLAGVKKPLFLGGYRGLEDVRQREDDEKVFYGLSQTVKPRNETVEKKPYIAFCVKTLDKGGLEEVVKLLATNFCEKGIPIKIFCLQKAGHIAEELKKSRIEVICFEGNMNKLQKLCEQEPPLLVNTHYVFEGLEVFREKDIPVIEVIHNTYVFLYGGDLARERQKSKFVTHYIAVSDEAKRIFLQKVPEVTADKITVIENAYSKVKESRVCREKIRSENGISEKTFVFIVVGSVCARKNQLGILRAWSIFKRLWLQESVLVFVGETTEPLYMKKIRKMCSERRLGESVMFLEHRDDVGDLMNAADVCILDSYYEGASMAALEALCAGTPLIHSDCGNGRSLIAEGRNGMLVENPLYGIERYSAAELRDAMNAGINRNIEMLVNAMLTMADQQEEWKKRKSEISEFARTFWTEEKMVNHYIEVFKKQIR